MEEDERVEEDSSCSISLNTEDYQKNHPSMEQSALVNGLKRISTKKQKIT